MDDGTCVSVGAVNRLAAISLRADCVAKRKCIGHIKYYVAMSLGFERVASRFTGLKLHFKNPFET